jgi:hypothetical protein
MREVTDLKLSNQIFDDLVKIAGDNAFSGIWDKRRSVGEKETFMESVSAASIMSHFDYLLQYSTW